MITILCADTKSNYYKIPGLDIYDINRDAYTYNGTNKIIAHPPCAQWSKLKGFANENIREKELAIHCWNLVNRNGGILEHPVGSDLFRYVNADYRKIVKVDQNWWGFKARKVTLLYVHEVKLLPTPITFDAIERKIESMSSRNRSIMTLEFCKYLVDSINMTQP